MGGIFKIWSRVPNVRVWLLRGWGRSLKVNLQTHALKNLALIVSFYAFHLTLSIIFPFISIYAIFSMHTALCIYLYASNFMHFGLGIVLYAYCHLHLFLCMQFVVSLSYSSLHLLVLSNYSYSLHLIIFISSYASVQMHFIICNWSNASHFFI
jgi:hypothetical protein